MVLLDKGRQPIDWHKLQNSEVTCFCFYASKNSLIKICVTVIVTTNVSVITDKRWCLEIEI